MMKRLVLGACAIVVLAGVALAQAVPQNDNPPPPQGAEQNDDGPQDGAGGWWGHRHGHGPRQGDRMGGGMMMQGKGFGIMIGRGQGLHVSCDNEPIKQCVDAAQPLIDALLKGASQNGAALTVTPKTP